MMWEIGQCSALLAEVNLDTASLQLFEAVAELAAMTDGQHVAVLALGDREREREPAIDVVAVAVAEWRGREDLALTVLHHHLGAAADIGVAVHAMAFRPVRRRSS